MMDKRKKFGTVLVIVSVVLNILLIGVLAGHKLRHFTKRDSGAVAEALPPEKRELFLTTVEQMRSQRRAVYTGMREIRQDIFRILTAPDFDGEAYQKRIDELYEMRKDAHLRSSLAIRELASQFNQEERKVIATYLQSKRSRGSRSSTGFEAHRNK